MEGFSEIVYQDFLVTYKDHLTSFMKRYMLFIRVFYWQKIWGFQSLFVTLTLYAVLIQDVKDLMEQSNIIVCHTLREENQCTDFLANLKASSDHDLVHHTSPQDGLLFSLKMAAAGTFFLREQFVVVFLFFSSVLFFTLLHCIYLLLT